MPPQHFGGKGVLQRSTSLKWVLRVFLALTQLRYMYTIVTDSDVGLHYL